MSQRSNDDLFAATTMSFGDHLEELRVCLFKAVIGLVLGSVIGLAFANGVVAYIQTPLKSALEEHYIAKAIRDLQHEYGGELPPEVHRFVNENRLVFERTYLEAGEWHRVRELAASTGARSSRPQAVADHLDADPAAAGKPPAGEMPEADDGRSAEAALILGSGVPVPRAPLMATRVWRPIHTIVKALNAQEAFMIWMKAGFVVGLVISSPYVFLQIWSFVAAGLYHHEKQYVHIYLPFSLVLFLAGAATAFFFVFKYVLQFLFGFNAAMQIDPDPRISEWLGFVLLMPLAFGVAFQLPLVMLFLHRIGIVSLEIYLSKWRMAVMIIFIASMFLTPADPVSMLLMAIPLTGLYFLGIGMCKWMPRHRRPSAEGDEP